MDGAGPQPLTPPLAADVARSGQADSQLDRELESALGIEPSPEFLARVRMRIAVEPGLPPWRLAVRRWAFEPLAGVAVIGIVLTVVVPWLMRTEERSIQPVAAKPPDVARPVDVTVTNRGEVSAAPVVRKAAAAPTVVANEVPLRLSQPLFSEDERRALVQLLTGVEEGRLPPVVSDTAKAPAALPDVRTALNIEPLVIDPLPLLALVPKEGEGQW